MLRRLKLKHWITAASLGFIAVALAQQSEQLRQIQLDAAAWGWLFLGFLLTGVSILVNGWAWRQVLLWLGHPPKDIAVVTLFVRSNLLKYLPGGIWHLVERVRVLRPRIGAGPALAGVILDPLLIVAAASLLLSFGGWQHGLLLVAPLPLLLLMLPAPGNRSCVDWSGGKCGSWRRLAPAHWCWGTQPATVAPGDLC